MLPQGPAGLREALAQFSVTPLLAASPESHTRAGARRGRDATTLCKTNILGLPLTTDTPGGAHCAVTPPLLRGRRGALEAALHALAKRWDHRQRRPTLSLGGRIGASETPSTIQGQGWSPGDLGWSIQMPPECHVTVPHCPGVPRDSPGAADIATLTPYSAPPTPLEECEADQDHAHALKHRPGFQKVLCHTSQDQGRGQRNASDSPFMLLNSLQEGCLPKSVIILWRYFKNSWQIKRWADCGAQVLKPTVFSSYFPETF